ncbi:MAG: hypothetical protein Q8K60_02635, partial [Parachlamydiaceae bacterium]|nr:hypothetical protein [Parachlamydiaceae bacterium]
HEIKNNSFNFLKVYFWDNPAFDGGGDGITRECLNILFRKISEHYSLKTNIPQFSRDHEVNFINLGVILYFLFRNLVTISQNPVKNVPNFPVGPVFKDNFFEGLFLFTKEELNDSFLNISNERIFEICLQFFNKDPQFIKLNHLLNWDETSGSALPNLDFINELLLAEMIDKPSGLEEDAINFNLLLKHKTFFQDSIKSEFINTQKGQLQTLFSIAKGLTLYPQYNERFWDVISPARFKEIIVGVEFCRNKLKEFLHFKPNVPTDVQEFFIDFVDRRNEEDLKYFLTFVTGSATLPYKNIQITMVDDLTGDQIRVLSCHHFIDIPKHLTISEIEINIEHWINEMKNKK